MTAPPALSLRYDLRLPAGNSAERKRLLDAALEQISWGEAHGFVAVTLSEHHGSPDGYLPSPIVFGAAVAARTTAIYIHIAALIAPLHDSLRIAEDLAVLDLLSGGRLLITIGAGYVNDEFEMFGRELSDRGKAVEEAVETLREAWLGEPFVFRGRTVCVTPRPFQEKIPIFLGGQTPAAARRAARIADGYSPISEAHYEHYRTAMVELGRPDPGAHMAVGPRFLYVAHDPDKAWSQISAACMHETNAYGRWAQAAGLDTGYYQFDHAEDLRASGQYPVLTPTECVDLCSTLGPAGMLIFHPLAGGMDPDLSWASLELFASEVLPVLNGERGT